jgi:lipoprotein-anchoring transpeptidase ErfK/SrfK
MTTGCTSPAPPPPGYADDGVSYWDGDHMSGSPFVHIKLGEQKAYFYKGGQLAGVSTISSGREGLGTPTGNFRIQHKTPHHRSTLFGNYVDAEGNIIKKEVDTRKDPKPRGAIFDGADMPYWMPITGNIGMHQGYLPGYPASHGCIRLPAAMAEAFYHSVSVGTPVKIEH